MAPVLMALVALPTAALVTGSSSAPPVAMAEEPAAVSAPETVVVAPSPTVSPARPRARPVPAPRRTAAPVEQKPLAERIPDRGSGTFHTADVKGPVRGRGGPLLRYNVRVEKELPFAADAAARQVQQILADPRSWVGSGDWRMQLVGRGERADFSVLITTPETTDEYCLPLRTRGRLSCQDGNRAVLNADRWGTGAPTWGRDVAGYRTYLVNHEVGHVLGHGHRQCPRKGAPAPVMVQQTKSLEGCRPNAWPAPRR